MKTGPTNTNVRIHEAILGYAASNPGRSAITSEDGSVSYGELRATVLDLADVIVRDTQPDSRIAVASAKTPETVVAMLSVLAAGRSYVPVDTGLPRERREFVLADAGCDLLLADTSAVDPDSWGIRVRPVSVDRHTVASSSPSLPSVTPDDEAYVLYTSGSTGTPKGVVITHRNASAFVTWAGNEFPLTADDRVAVHAPLHFDLPVYDLYVGLSSGAQLFFVPERTSLFPQALLDFLRDNSITSLYAVPSALTAMVNRASLGRVGLPALEQLLYAGEEFRPDPLRRLWQALPNAAVANLYGPIETNVVTSHRVRRGDLRARRIPIGRPTTTARIELLDECGGMVEEGSAEGEIVVSGDCVTPGYLNRPDLTKAALTTLATPDGPRTFYRTGDLAHRDRDGTLHLLGRRDGMVKTRGYRVEIGEIESVLASHPDVADVAVLAEPDPVATHLLRALVVPRRKAADALKRELVRHTRATLPGYMVPSGVYLVQDLPRTSTGKIARTELSATLSTCRSDGAKGDDTE